jgi:hypothetical protein
MKVVQVSVTKLEELIKLGDMGVTGRDISDRLRGILKEGGITDTDEEPARAITLLEYLKTVEESPLKPRAWWHIALMNGDAPLRFTSWFTTTFRSTVLVAAQRASLEDAPSFEEQTNPFEFWDVLAFMWAKAKL